MRKLSGKVKAIMIVFVGLVLLLGGAFGIVVYYSISNKSERIVLSSNCVAYDDNGNKIILSEPSSIYKSYYGGYVLKDLDNNVYSLGDNTVVYDENVLKVFGGGYQILNDTEVSIISEYAEIADLDTPAFFKLADRKYLITGSEISGDDSSTLSTSNYLYIVMDKSGNAMLLNDELCEKTKSALSVGSGGAYAFDIAKETLSLGDGTKSVDCGPIIGSTNEYDESTDKDKLRQRIEDLKAKGEDIENEDEMVINAKGGPGGIGGVGGTGGSGGQGGAGGAGGTGGEGGVGTAPKVSDARKAMNIYSINALYTTASVEYSVNDPYGQFGEVSFIYTNTLDATDTNKITADIDGTRMTLYNLEPGSRYKLQLVSSKDATVEAVQYFYTAVPIATIDNVFFTENSITFTVHYENNLSFSQAVVVLASSDKTHIIDQTYVSVDKASSSGDTITFSGLEFNKQEIENNLVLYFTNVKFNGKDITIDSSSFITNPYRCKYYWDQFVKENQNVMNYYCLFDGSGNPTTTNAPNDGNTRTNIEHAIDQYRDKKNNYGDDFVKRDINNIYNQLVGIHTKYWGGY